jgi:ATP-dependent DNA helicase RecG
MERLNIKRDTHLKSVQKLTLPVSTLKGVGPKRAVFFGRKGIRTILDLLFFTPIRYEDRTKITPIHEAQEGTPVQVQGKVVFGKEERFFRSTKRIFRIMIHDEGAGLELLWFNFKKPHLTATAAPGSTLLAYGSVTWNHGRRQMVHPEVMRLAKEETAERLGFYPVYSSVEGMSSAMVRSLMMKALQDYLTLIVDPVPAQLAEALGLPSLEDALRSVHFPPKACSIADLNAGQTAFHKRLLFDRFFLVMLTIAFRKRDRKRKACPSLTLSSHAQSEVERIFPFKLTRDQTRAVRDILQDLSAGKPMSRLLLGDVGCGKTAVAAVAAYTCVLNNGQTAIMAPTQVLASQHLEYFSGLSEKMGFRPALLTGTLHKSEREGIYRKIREGRCNVVIGTQSLIQENLVFQNLGLVIIDEQHRFGVRERALIDRKGNNPHLLVMTATPIPRTLAMTVYGDMDVSVIKEYPRGHVPASTRLVSETEKREVFDFLRARLSQGEQAFVICPVIEGSEELDLKNATEMAQKLAKILSPPYRVGLMHGRLPVQEREAAMADFRGGRIDLLVGTTVVEVGVHVPNATLMIIEHPERFGLAQLHQLRGRVGRGSDRGVCFLMASGSLSENALSRLKVLVDHHDGFEIAQKDLQDRGYGELIGTKQTGLVELDLLEIMKEPDLLNRAKEEAEHLLDADPDLSKAENRTLKDFVESILSRPIDL